MGYDLLSRICWLSQTVEYGSVLIVSKRAAQGRERGQNRSQRACAQAEPNETVFLSWREKKEI